MRNIFSLLFSALFLFFCIVTLHAFDNQTLIMINPSGDAKNVGRKLVEGYERAQTFEFAKALQEALQERHNVRAVLTRFPGEEIVDLQNASFANRLGVDFYLSINFYRQEVIKPKVFMYHLVYNPMVDLARRIFDPLEFVPLYQSHFKNIHKTVRYGKLIKDVLSVQHYRKMFDVHGLYGVPLKFLCGIVAPAIAIEIGICQEEQWKVMIDPLVASLSFLGETKGNNS